MEATPPSTESKTQREARLRRERRNAKLQAGGSERLSKISSVSGRPAAAAADLSRTPSIPQDNSSAGRRERSSSNSNTNTNDDDPAEVDISKMFQQPSRNTNVEEQQQIFREMLRANGNEGAGAQGQGSREDMAEDPMMRMMQQMLGTSNANGQGSAEMFGSASDRQTTETRDAEFLWRIVHAMFSFLLGLYAVSTLSFTGSSLSRSAYVTDSLGPRLFWMFATAEVVLQTTRYFVDRGKLPPSGWMGKLSAFLPEPFAGYIRVLNRYSITYTTVVSDALVVLFILGVTAWWRGLADG